MDCEPDRENAPAITAERWHELRCHLSMAVDELDRREQFIIRARLSLGPSGKVYAVETVAARLGVSKQRVLELEKRAISKMQATAAGFDRIEPRQ